MGILLLISGYFKLTAGIESLIISEFCVINDTVIQDEFGGYPDWIELYNNSSSPVNLFDLYISDDPFNILKFKFQTADLVVDPHSYIVLWADNEPDQGLKHVGFKLSKGEYIILFNSSYGIIDSVKIMEGIPNYSVGRTDTEKTWTWEYFTEPTPGTVNNTQSFAGIAGTPVFNITGGFYNSAIDVTFSTSNPLDEIYYTLDSHDPEPGNPNTFLYEGTPVSISSTQVMRAQCFRSDYLPGKMVSNIYFLNENYSLPVLVTMTDPDNLTGPLGIYSNPWKEGYEWERFAQHQYFIRSQLQFSNNSGI